MLMCLLLLWIGSWLISRPNTEAPSWHHSPGRPDSHCWWIGYTEPFHHRGSTHCLHRNRCIFQIWICFSHLQCFCQHHHVDSQDARFIPMVSHLKLFASEELSWVERQCGNRLIPTEIHWFYHMSHHPETTGLKEWWHFLLKAAMVPQPASSGHCPTETSTCFKPVANTSLHLPHRPKVWVQGSRGGCGNDPSHWRNNYFPIPTSWTQWVKRF